jgi:hypothetical protein
MKSLKFVLLTLFVTVFGLSVFSQSFGVRAGLNMSNFEVKDDTDTYSDDYMFLPGFHAGILAEVPVAGIISVEGGAFFSTRGFRFEDEMVLFDDKVEIKYKTTLYYLVVPITAKATVDVGPVEIFGQLGGYVGAGLSGKYKGEYTSGGLTNEEESDVKWGNDELEDDYKQLDFGLTAGAGVQVNKIRAGIAYDHGLANICPYSENNYRCNNRVFSVFVAIVLGGN